MCKKWILFGIVSALVCSLSAGILLFAYVNAPTHEGTVCFVSVWHAKYPMALGCAMSSLQDLSGGLVGGAGALIAAMLAAIFVWEQIDQSRMLATREYSRRRELELMGLHRLKEYYDEIIIVFEKSQGAPDVRYVNGMDALYKQGLLLDVSSTAPSDFQSIAHGSFLRLANLNHALENSRNMGAGGTVDTKSRTEINGSINTTIDRMIVDRDQIRVEISHRATEGFHTVAEIMNPAHISQN
jgi:hypothetical protein